MYELFLLGKLLDRPWHGYEFQKAINAFIGPMRRVSWGTIYPMIRRLEKKGLIKHVSTRSTVEDKRGRQRYSITAAGKRAFLELMRPEHLNDANYRDTFRVMLGHFSRIDAQTRFDLVESYLKLLSAVISHAEAMSKRVTTASELEDAERKDILVALERDRFLAEAEREWILEKDKLAG